MKHFILPIALGLALVSCNRDNDNNSGNEETPILPVKISGGVDDYTEFKYNGDKLTEIITKDEDVESRSVVEYTGDLITSITAYDGSKQIEKTTYKYENGKIVESTEKRISEQGNEYSGVTTYTYNADGTITLNHNDSRNQYISTITISNGNITKRVSDDGTILSEYDTYNNPFKNVRGMSALLPTIDDFGFANNILKEVETKNNGDTYINTYTYDYNANNFPTKQVMKYGNDTEATTYTYNK